MTWHNPPHNKSSLFAHAFAAINEAQDPQSQPPLPPPPPPSPQHELNNNDTDSEEEEEEAVAELVINEVDDEFEAWWTQCGGGSVVMADNGNAIGGVNHDGITIKNICDGVVSNGTLKNM